MRIYVASSWRNEQQPAVVNLLRKAGHDVYDFRNSEHAWREIDPNWESWSVGQFDAALATPRAMEAFKTDFDALRSCQALVLIMPCGRSAHLEAGYAIGAKKPTCILLAEGEPELMYNMADRVFNAAELVDWANNVNTRMRLGLRSIIEACEDVLANQPAAAAGGVG